MDRGRCGGAALALAVFAGSGVASAQQDHSGAIKARIAYMQLNGFFMGQLAGIAKGQVPLRRGAGDRGCQQSARALDHGRGRDVAAWAPTTMAVPGKTRALPELWTTFPAVMEKANALTTALEAMVVAAGTDLASLQGRVRRGRRRLRRLPSTSFRAENF